VTDRMTAIEFLARLETGAVQAAWEGVEAKDVPEYVASEWGDFVKMANGIEYLGGVIFTKLRDLAVQEEMLA
jgi:hypothetical protein